MEKHEINNSEKLFFIFETKSKRRVLDVINGKGRMPYLVEEKELVIQGDTLALPIDLSKWKDIDDDSDFTNVLKALKKITDSKRGTPLLVIGATVIGYDCHRKMNFTFSSCYKDGKHALMGVYEDETKMFYTEDLYLD